MRSLECGTFGAFVLRTAEDKNATCVNGLPLVSPAIRMLGRFNKLRSIQHPMLNQYLELSCCNIAKNTVVIVTDQYDKTLMDVLDSESFSCDDMPQLAIDIISTIGYLHDKGLTHGSLSLESIKVLEAPVANGPDSRKYPIRLSQYGLSYLTNNGVDVSPYETQQHFHKSPEQYIHPHSNYFSTASSDIWAFGLILLQLYRQVVLSQVQTKPQYAAMLEKLIERADWDTAYYDVLIPIQNAQDNEKLDIDEKCEDLISACLQILPCNRPTSLQVEQSLIECFSDRSDLIHSMPQDDLDDEFGVDSSNVTPTDQSTIISTLPVNQLYGLWKICGAGLEAILIKKGVIDIQSPMVTIPVVDVDESSSFGNEQSSYFDSDSCTFKLPMDKLHEKIKGLDYAAIVRQLYPISDEHQEMNEHRRDAKSLTMTVKEKDFTYQLLRILKVQHILDAVYCEEHEFSLYNEAYIDIPPSLRAEVWRSLLGINHFKYLDHTLDTLDVLEPHSSDRQLDVDIPRCHQYKETMTSPYAHVGLRRILKGWLTANKNYTYWQGCDSLAAPFLLLNFEKPELALDCMDVFIHRYLKDFFVENNNDIIQEYLRVFNQLLAYVDPELHSHLAELQFEPQLYAIPWFLTCFAHVLPMDKIFLVWDQIILHDSSFPLMVGLAIMKQFRSSLINASFNTVIETFSQLPNLNINLLVDDSRYYHKIIPKSCTFRMHDSGFKGHDIQEDNDFMQMPASNSDELKKLSSPQLSIYEMIHKLSQRKLVVLDVRSPAEYSNGSIIGAIHVPVEAINTFVSSPKHSLPDVPVCILWSSGIEMAVTASKALVSNAVKNICTLAGGFEALKSFPQIISSTK